MTVELLVRDLLSVISSEALCDCDAAVRDMVADALGVDVLDIDALAEELRVEERVVLLLCDIVLGDDGDTVRLVWLLLNERDDDIVADVDADAIERLFIFDFDTVLVLEALHVRLFVRALLLLVKDLLHAIVSEVLRLVDGVR